MIPCLGTRVETLFAAGRRVGNRFGEVSCWVSWRWAQEPLDHLLCGGYPETHGYKVFSPWWLFLHLSEQGDRVRRNVISSLSSVG